MSGGVSDSFIVYASRSALEDAERFGLGVVESLVEAAIMDGRANGRADARRVYLAGGYVAHTITKDRTPGGRRKLLVTRVDTDHRTTRRLR